MSIQFNDEIEVSKVVNKISYQFESNEHVLKQPCHDTVIVEQPLQIKLHWTDNNQDRSRVYSITMRTPNDDKKLIIGLLYGEKIITHINDIINIQHEFDNINVWEIKLRDSLVPDLSELDRYQLSYSSCGLCGTTSLKSLEMKEPPELSHDMQWLSPKKLAELPTKMMSEQLVYDKTGGAHCAAMFNNQFDLISIHEDIGRHNAVDKTIGDFILNHSSSFSDKILIVSSRVSFEVVQKTIMAGIPVLIAVGAPSDLAITTAKRFNLTLIGFTSKRSFNVYHGDHRLTPIKKELS